MATDLNFVGIIGNNSTQSTNRTLMHYIAKHFADQAEIEVFEIRDIPPFKVSDDKIPPAELRPLMEAIEASDGVVIATPEYDHTVPAALKSVLEWLSWTSEVLRWKPVMISGASYGRLGTSRAQDHLRQILTSPFIQARVLAPQFLLGDSLQAFDNNGDLIKESDITELDSVWSRFMIFTQLVKSVEGKEVAQ
ncbi:NADPH-dependent FMN reductase [Corynebacterium lubricantis]|uniref:NADPH-dependent FMN reductase n=1 Tax=Corynebacterium lubricantis TaxID=541095 RepID=UPI00035F0CB1|nr:NADPH-dependent FMN reductase [Corynebacterium lubricantis]